MENGSKNTPVAAGADVSAWGESIPVYVFFEIVIVNDFSHHLCSEAKLEKNFKMHQLSKHKNIEM